MIELIYKKCDRFCNYRPITLLSSIDKLFTPIRWKRLTEWAIETIYLHKYHSATAHLTVQQILVSHSIHLLPPILQYKRYLFHTQFICYRPSYSTTDTCFTLNSSATAHLTVQQILVSHSIHLLPPILQYNRYLFHTQFICYRPSYSTTDTCFTLNSSATAHLTVQQILVSHSIHLLPPILQYNKYLFHTQFICYRPSYSTTDTCFTLNSSATAHLTVQQILVSHSIHLLPPILQYNRYLFHTQFICYRPSNSTTDT